MEVNVNDITVDTPLNVDGGQLKENGQKNYRGGVILLVASGFAAIAAGVITSAVAKKRANQYLKCHGHELKELPESGIALALKALCYSTIITLGMFSISVFGVCKWFDIKNMDDLRTKLRKARKVSPPDPTERTEFESLTDFLNYLNDRYGEPKNKNSQKEFSDRS